MDNYDESRSNLLELLHLHIDEKNRNICSSIDEETKPIEPWISEPYSG